MQYRGFEIGCIPDCDENKSGFYCEVYTLEPYDKIDDFCIHPEELAENPDTEYWRRKYIDGAYSEYIQNGIVRDSRDHDPGKRSEAITVLVVAPMKDPYPRDINGLAEMQQIVGGPIEAVYPFEDQVAVVCNMNGKLSELTANRLLKTGSGVPYDVICGTFFIAGLGEEDFTSLTDLQLRKYTKLYSNEMLHIVSRTPQKNATLKKKSEVRHER